MAERAEMNGGDPVELFHTWMSEAETMETNDPNAAALATSTPDGHPSVRMVLIKSVDEEGFTFFTNGESRKGQELQANRVAALCFHWKSLRRQVRVEGTITGVADDAVDHYFHSRSRGSQIAAAVSAQSRPLASREQLEAAVAAFTATHEGKEIPRPSFWKGFLLRPAAIEFWADGPDRLHDRVVFEGRHGDWSRTRLYP